MLCVPFCTAGSGAGGSRSKNLLERGDASSGVQPENPGRSSSVAQQHPLTRPDTSERERMLDSYSKVISGHALSRLSPDKPRD